MEAIEDATCAEKLAAAGIGGSSAHRIMGRDLELNPPRKIEAQRAKPTNGQNRLEIPRRWDTHIRTGEMGMWEIYLGDEKLLRVGAFAGGNDDLVAYVQKELKRGHLPNALILREDGARQGGAAVMANFGMRHEGKGSMRLAPEGTKIESAGYLEIAKNKYLRVVRRYMSEFLLIASPIMTDRRRAPQMLYRIPGVYISDQRGINFCEKFYRRMNF